jgi:hypothetical protein
VTLASSNLLHERGGAKAYRRLHVGHLARENRHAILGADEPTVLAVAAVWILATLVVFLDARTCLGIGPGRNLAGAACRPLDEALTTPRVYWAKVRWRSLLRGASVTGAGWVRPIGRPLPDQLAYF